MTSETLQRTVITLDCPKCEDVDVRSVVEHPPGSPQSVAVHAATKTLATEHTDETGHVPAVTKRGRRTN
ncbi:hypothetical protein [Halomarina oriensis]|uniref:Uncharacterized protein n=1 Tax=Halomarina oriensis TaxID=671145 RepID=A0A6B0GNJ8_9EURY|nr:hypothetical protein [Halomarina oriensis]MWG36506.1 hypothetical protein [Halomarina oriensis]